jgi:hypothetical protein
MDTTTGSNGKAAAKEHRAPVQAATDGRADPDIAGVLGANVDKLAATSFRYHREVRDFCITRRRIAPDGTEGEDWTPGVGESAAELERRRLMELEADFRSALSCLAADVRYSRDSLIELLVFSHGAERN